MSALRANEAPFVDNDGVFWIACIGKEIIRGTSRHGGRRYASRSEKRTVLGSQRPARRELQKAEKHWGI
jgi:hypothetical protein